MENHTISQREDLYVRVGAALLAVLRSSEEASERAAAAGNMNATDFRCIGFLKSCGAPASPKQIIAHLGLTSGSGTALLDRLEKAGYIRRMPNPADRRGVLVVLDETAAAIPLARYHRVHESYRSATDSFSAGDLEIIAAYLERVAQLTGAMGADDALTPSG